MSDNTQNASMPRAEQQVVQQVAQQVTEILDGRGSTHGDFRLNSSVSQNIKTILRLDTNYGNLPSESREALDMIVHKLGRILEGNYVYLDHWIDIAGYATLAYVDTLTPTEIFIPEFTVADYTSFSLELKYARSHLTKSTNYAELDAVLQNSVDTIMYYILLLATDSIGKQAGYFKLIRAYADLTVAYIEGERKNKEMEAKNG